MASLMDDSRVRMGIIVAGAIGAIALGVYFLFIAKGRGSGPGGSFTSADLTGCAYLETMARTLDLQGVPLESGLTREELTKLATCSGPYSTYAANWLAAHPLTGGGGGGTARTR